MFAKILAPKDCMLANGWQVADIVLMNNMDGVSPDQSRNHQQQVLHRVDHTFVIHHRLSGTDALSPLPVDGHHRCLTYRPTLATVGGP